MAAPTDSARQGTNISTAGTSHAINVGSPASGTLLIVLVRAAASPGSMTFTGYTALVDLNQTDATDDTTSIYWRWADGTEGATDTLTTGNSVKLAAICWEVTGAENAAPAVSTVNTGTTSANTATSNSVAPTGAPQDTLYITMAAGDGEVGAYTAAPTNYGNLATANSGTGGAAATNCFLGGASRQITSSSSDDAGTFTHGAHTTGWTAFAVAIRPQPAGTNHTRNVDDTLGLADSASAVRGIKVAVNDTLGLADSMADQEGWRRLPADTLSLADSFSRTLAFARAINDTLALADSQTKVTGFRRSPADSFSLADSITPLIILSRAVNDTLTLADSLARSLGYRRLPADTLALADSLSRSLVYQRSPADSLGLADSLVRALTFSRSLGDTLGLSDSIDVDFSGGAGEPAPDTGWPVGALTLADRGRALSADAVTLAGGASGRGAAKTASGQTDA